MLSRVCSQPDAHPGGSAPLASDAVGTTDAPYRLGFVFEQALGHITHQENLVAQMAGDPAVDSTWFPISYRPEDRPGGGSLIGRNLSLSLGLQARRLVRDALRRMPLDGLFFHTQITSLLCADLMRRIPSVISLDATPFSKASLGYRTPGGGEPRGQRGLIGDFLKKQLYRHTLGHAAALTTWNQWTADSLVRDYGIPSDKITVIPPGVDTSFWRPVRRPPLDGRKARLLFVGGDFTRKGGRVLLEAFRAGLADRCELIIVTGADRESVAPEGGIRAFKGLSPNSEPLRRLFDEADLFILPTFQDCTPIAIIEAMASGLPVIATDVGAIREEVQHGHNGLLIPRDDPTTLIHAVNTFLSSPDFLRSAGFQGRHRAERHFNGEVNYRSLLDLLKRCVDERPTSPLHDRAGRPIRGPGRWRS